MNRRPPRISQVELIRNRFRKSKEILLPNDEKRVGIPSVRDHARLFAAVLLGFVVLAGFILWLPFATRSGEHTTFVDALFTAVSSLCVTGLAAVDTGTHWSTAGQVIMLILVQTGGLGFMVGASLVLRVLQRRATGLHDAMLLQDGAPTLTLREARSLSGRIIRFTLIVEAVGATVLFFLFLPGHGAGESAWKALFYSICAFCNAGFDLDGNFQSLQPYRGSWAVSLTIMALIQFGALSYLFFADLGLKRRWRTLALETKLILIVHSILLAGGMLIFMVAEWQNTLQPVPMSERPLVALFHSVSVRTAGYTTVNFADVTSITTFTFVALMFVGGASASTAGGVKLTTVGVLAVAVLSTLRGRQEPQLFGRRIPMSLVLRAMAVFTMMFFFHFLSTLAMTISEHFTGGEVTFLAMMFETMSAIGTVGLSTGITPFLSDASKLILCVTMIFGRLGPLTVVYALQARQKAIRYRFPEEAIRIG